MRSCFKTIVAILLCSMVLFSVTACEENASNNEENTAKALSVRGTHLFPYGNYIYYEYAGIVFRYNVKTSEFSSACVLPICSHDYRDNCPMWGILSSSFIENNRLYYTNNLDEFTFESYSFLDGSQQVLKTLSKHEAGSTLMQTDGTYIYYYYKTLKDGGDPENTEDYQWGIFRQPLEGGKEEYLFEENDHGNLLFVSKDRMIFERSSGEIISTDIYGENIQLLFSLESVTNIESEHLYGEELYFLGTDGTYETDANGQKVYHKLLYRVNIQTGEYIQVLDDYVSTFTIDGDRVYYLPLELKTLYSPPNFGKEGNKEACMIYTADFTWYSCNLNGEDVREQFSQENVIHNGLGRVIDGNLYAGVCYFDPETHSFSDTYFVEVNMETGETKEICNINELIQNRN